MSLIVETLLAYLPVKKKHTPSGWISFNAPCCGDKRARGGFIVNGGDAVSYHCFNCGFKASWQPGRTISKKLKELMYYFNIPDEIISKLQLEALKLHETRTENIRSIVPSFEIRALPMDSQLITSFKDDIPEKLVPVLEYLSSRGLYLDDYPFYWCPNLGFSNRLIIPFFYHKQIVGYTARIINSNVNPRYISEQQPGYVFNLDKQLYDRDFVIVCEGPIDAISIDGCAIMGSEIKVQHDWALKRLNKQIVLVPDRDHEGPKSVERAMELGWAVSMPEWPDGVKDINDAIVKLGRVATLWLITDAIETYNLKIELRSRAWFKGVKKK